MTTMTSAETLRLTAPEVGEADVSAEFAGVVGAHIQQARDFLASKADGFPAGFVQQQGAHAPNAETERDFYVEKFSEAFGAGTYGFDEAMTRYERDVARRPDVLTQHPDDGPATVTLNLGARVKKHLGIPTDRETIIEGCTHRQVVFGADGQLSPGDRLLILDEYEIPVTDKVSHGQTMARVVLFAPAKAN